MSGPWVAAFLALAGLSLFTLAVVVGVLRRVLPVLEAAADRQAAPAADGPRPGAPLPATVTAAELTRDGPAVLLLVDEGCEPCRELLAELRADGVRLDSARLYLVVGDDADLGALPAGPGLVPLRQRAGAISGALGVDVVPSAAAVAGGVVVQWQPLGSVAQLQRLVELAEASGGRLAAAT
jgi:hypothetical protein